MLKAASADKAPLRFAAGIQRIAASRNRRCVSRSNDRPPVARPKTFESQADMCQDIGAREIGMSSDTPSASSSQHAQTVWSTRARGSTSRADNARESVLDERLRHWHSCARQQLEKSESSLWRAVSAQGDRGRHVRLQPPSSSREQAHAGLTALSPIMAKQG